MDDSFGVKPVKMLFFPEPMRQRPDMYVGDVSDGSGLHRMVEIPVDDALVRRPTRVSVALQPDGAVRIIDDGVPFPDVGPFVGSLCKVGDARVPGSIATAAATALTTIMTHGSGVLAVVNGLSSRFDVRFWRDGGTYCTTYEEGHLVDPVVRTGPAPLIAGAPKQGTEVTFFASTAIFGSVAYDRGVITRYLDDLAERHPEVGFTLA